jgi:uncharacterized OsmC-like protein
MKAARAGVEFGSLEIEVDSESDDRRILGIDESTPAGPISTRIESAPTASQTDRDELRHVIERGTIHCPVFDATQRAVEMKLEIEESTCPRGAATTPMIADRGVTRIRAPRSTTAS